MSKFKLFRLNVVLKETKDTSFKSYNELMDEIVKLKSKDNEYLELKKAYDEAKMKYNELKCKIFNFYSIINDL